MFHCPLTASPQMKAYPSCVESLTKSAMLPQCCAFPPAPWNQNKTGIGFWAETGVINDMHRAFFPSLRVTTSPPTTPFTEQLGVYVSLRAAVTPTMDAKTFDIPDKS